MRVLSLLIFAGLSLPSAIPVAANAQGTLLIIGGGLLPNNASVFERMIDAAGGRGGARFGIIPTASLTDAGAKRFAARLVVLKVPAAQIQIIDLTVANAKQQ